MLNQNHARVYEIWIFNFFLTLSTFVSISLLPWKIWDLSEEVLPWCLASRVPPTPAEYPMRGFAFFLGNMLTRSWISPGCCHWRSHAQSYQQPLCTCAAGMANAHGRSHQAPPRAIGDCKGDWFLEVVRFIRFLLSRCKSTNPWLHLESSDTPSPSPLLAALPFRPGQSHCQLSAAILTTLHVPSLFFLINESSFLILWN